MFGLSEQEMDLYRDFTHDFAVKEVAPRIVEKSLFLTPAVKQDDEYVTDNAFLRMMIVDVETITTITAMNMAYEYAYLQSEESMSEKEIIQHLHDKYDYYVMEQFVKYAMALSSEVSKQIVGDIILELPYIYVSIFEEEAFDEDDFLERKLDAYNDYLNENFTEEDDEEHDEEFEEEYDEEE